jgi:hypothetical protein
MKQLVLICVVLLIACTPAFIGGGEVFTLSLTEAAGLVPCDGVKIPCNACTFTVMANGLIQYLFTILTLVVVLMIVYTGFKLVISQGDTGAWSKAKDMFTNVVIGFIIILSAWLIVDTLMKVLVGDNSDFGPWNSLSSSRADCVGTPINNNTTGGGPR